MESTGVLWKPYDEIESWMGQFTERMEAACVPFAAALEKITEVPGYSQTAAENLGADYFLKLHADRAACYHRKVLESLGYTVIPPDANQAA